MHRSSNNLNIQKADHHQCTDVQTKISSLVTFLWGLLCSPQLGNTDEADSPRLFCTRNTYLVPQPYPAFNYHMEKTASAHVTYRKRKYYKLNDNGGVINTDFIGTLSRHGHSQPPHYNASNLNVEDGQQLHSLENMEDGEQLHSLSFSSLAAVCIFLFTCWP